MGVLRFTHTAAALGLMLMLSACTGGSSSDGRAGAGPTADRSASPPASASASSSPEAAYVSLGDSFTAGPGLPQPQPDAGYCQRSSLNWPSLLAARIKAESFADLSCSGATTADQATTVGTTARLGAGTRLVTISVGGNDGALFTSLISACSSSSGSCSQYVRDEAPSTLGRTSSSVSDLVEDVRAKAPEARIVVVGYLPILPTSGTCADAGIPAAQVPFVVTAEKLLETALHKAADRSGTEFVSVRSVAKGHDACSGDRAWTNGSVPAAGDGIFFHPRRAGMEAVADEVAARLTSTDEQ